MKTDIAVEPRRATFGLTAVNLFVQRFSLAKGPQRFACIHRKSETPEIKMEECTLVKHI